MKKVILILMILYNGFIFSQIEMPGKPHSFSLEKDLSEKYKLELEWLDNVKLKNDYEESIKNDTTPKPSRIGEVRMIDFDFMKNAERVQNGEQLILRYKFVSKGALSIQLGFKNFRLAEGTKVYAYKNKNSKVFGAFTKINENPNGGFAIAFYEGEEVILELNTSIHSVEKNILQLDYLGHAYDDVVRPGTSGHCNNNVNCQDWDEWCNQIRSVAMFTYPKFSCEGGFGLYSCSGALVNNYYDDFTPYFLTAEHCGTCTIDLERAVFYFNRQSPECYNANGVDDYRVSGARDLSSCSGPDVRLIQINKPIPLQYNVYFSGWDTRARNDMPSHTVVGIHHPQSDLKKISKGRWYNNWYNYTFRNNFWEVCWFDGIMEPGSSGAPIFEEQTKRIIGVHSNGSRGLNCNDEGDFCKWIGKLRYCWHDGGIQKYLGKGIATVNLDGADPVRACLSNINMFGYFGDAREYRAVKHQIRIQGKDRINIGNPIEYTEFKSNANFIITARDEINITDNTGDFHFDEIFTWNQYNYNDVELEMYTAPCQYTEEECGFNYFKMASAGKISNLVELEKESTEIIIHPNPTTQNSTLTIIGYQDKKVEILVLDQSGKTIFSKTMSKVESKEATIDIESRYWAKGIYIVRVTNNQDTKALKLVKE